MCGRVGRGRNRGARRIGERVIVRPLLRSYVRLSSIRRMGTRKRVQRWICAVRSAPPVKLMPSIVTGATKNLLLSLVLTHRRKHARYGRGGRVRVLVTGASGGVGLAALQLAKRRGATVIGICPPNKAAEVRAQGADQTLDRNSDLVAALGSEAVDVVIDLVGRPQLRPLLELLRRGGRCAVAGAIGGPIVEIDIRTVYQCIPGRSYPVWLHLPGRPGVREPGPLHRKWTIPACDRACISA